MKKTKMKKKIQMVAVGDDGMAHGYIGGQLVCPLCGKAKAESQLLPMLLPGGGGRSTAVCEPCGRIVTHYLQVVDLAAEFAEQDDCDLPPPTEYLN